jgi:outer membrane protein assembly factor BamB
LITGGDCVTGHDPATGAELWRANGLNPDNDPFYRIVASPVIFNDIIYAPTRVRPLLALKAVVVVISHRHICSGQQLNGPDVPTPVTDGKYFYVVNDRGIMWCLDAKTGREIYGQQRIKPGTYSASSGPR